MQNKIGVIPSLAIIPVGNNHNKRRVCEYVGINSFEVHISADSMEPKHSNYFRFEWRSSNPQRPCAVAITCFMLVNSNTLFFFHPSHLVLPISTKTIVTNPS